MAKSTSKLFKEEEQNLPETSEKQVEENVVPASSTTVEDVQDLNISAIKKKRFRINGDNNRILELNTSDLNISSRLDTSYKKLQKYMEEVGNILTNELPDDESELTEEQELMVNNQLNQIDEMMKKEIDYIFDAPVSEVCAYDGSMYDPFEGAFRFEHIIEAIAKLYENNLSNEFAKMKKRVSVKTSKYTKKYHR